MKLIDISTKKHPNTFAIVDDDGFDFLNQWKWCVGPCGYVARGQWEGGRVRTIKLHHLVVSAPPGMQRDHINGNRLDNRRENLRVCTHAENGKNKKPRAGRSLFKGVSWRPDKGLFAAGIRANGRRLHLGYFRTEQDAASAYNDAAVKYYGEFASLNQIEVPA